MDDTRDRARQLFTYREDGVKAATESIQWIKGLLARIDDIGMERIAEVISRNDAIESSRFLRETFLPGARL